MQLKEKIYAACLTLIDNKIQNLQVTLRELGDGAISDGKSSAGDKHETARAMMQLEQEKISKQLDEVLIKKGKLHKLTLNQKTQKVISSSLVKTNHGYLFLAVALGKIVIDNTSVVVLSPQSPLGLKLLGLEKDGIAQLNNINYIVEEIS